MEVSVHRPVPPLDGFVESITAFSDYRPGHGREILLPDGAVEIVVDLSERPKSLFDGPDGPILTEFRNAWVSGLRDRPIVIEAQQGAALLIIRLRPEGAGAILGPAIAELGGRVVDLHAVLDRAALSLRDRILAAGDLDEAVAAALSWVGERAPVAPDPLVRWLVRRLHAQTACRIADLADSAGLGERQLRNRFRAQTGIGLKRFQRIARFQRVLGAVSRGRGEDWEDRMLRGARLARPDWADLAQEFGYSDQSHLTADFAAFAGMSPGKYAARYRGMASHLPTDPAVSDFSKTGGDATG